MPTPTGLENCANVTCMSVNDTEYRPTPPTSSVSENVKRKLQQRLMEIQAKKKRAAETLPVEAFPSTPVTNTSKTPDPGWTGKMENNLNNFPNWDWAGKQTFSPNVASHNIRPISLRDLKVLTSSSYCTSTTSGGRDISSHHVTTADDMHRIYCLECSRVKTDIRKTDAKIGPEKRQEIASWAGNGLLGENRKPADMMQISRSCWQQFENIGSASAFDKLVTTADSNPFSRMNDCFTQPTELKSDTNSISSKATPTKSEPLGLSGKNLFASNNFSSYLSTIENSISSKLTAASCSNFLSGINKSALNDMALNSVSTAIPNFPAASNSVTSNSVTSNGVTCTIPLQGPIQQPPISAKKKKVPTATLR